MVMHFTIGLPSALGRAAKSKGLLEKEAVVSMFEEALRRKAAEDFLASTLTGDDDKAPQLTDEDIVREVKQVRAARKKALS